MGKLLTPKDIARTRAELEWWLQMARAAGYRCMFTHYYQRNPKSGYIESEDLVLRVVQHRKYCATTCVLISSDIQVIARGAAVTGGNDLPFKTDGRLRSLKRALTAAMIHIQDNRRLSRNRVEHCDTPLYRSELAPNLTSIELARLHNLQRHVAAKTRLS